MAKAIEMKFKQVKETKNMVKYEEATDEDRAISLYLRKSDVEKGKLGKSISVTITAA